MRDCLAVEGVGASVRAHRLKQIGALLVRHLREISGLWALVFDDENHHATVAAVTDETVGRLAENVRRLTSCHNCSRKAYEAPCSIQLVRRLRFRTVAGASDNREDGNCEQHHDTLD